MNLGYEIQKKMRQEKDRERMQELEAARAYERSLERPKRLGSVPTYSPAFEALINAPVVTVGK